MDGTSLPADLAALLAEREWLRGLARALAAGGSEAEDLEQETWVAALRSPPRRPGPVRGWLATVLRRKVLDARRAAGRRAAREEAAARPEAVPPAAEAVARAELRRRVLEAVLALEEPGRSTVILRFFEGLPPRDIAARTSVPVETVRTRLRRALETLRARLDEGHGGRREAWAVPLLAAEDPPEGGPGGEGDPPVPPATPRRPAPFLVPAAALVLLAAGALLLLHPRGPGGGPAAVPPGPAVAEAPGPAGPADGAAATPREGAAPAKGPAAPAPSAAAAAEDPAPEAPAAAGLVLRARVEPAAPRFQEKVRLVATFENAGKEPLKFFIPEMAGWVVPFPEWSLRGPGGERSGLSEGPWPQSMWRAGPIGEIVRLAPGESRSVETPIHGLLPGEGGNDEAPRPLRPGAYVGECVYRCGPKIPWTETFGDSGVEREVEGLWTGSVAADPFGFQVLPGDVPALGLVPMGPVVPGKPCLVEITLVNTAARPLELRGRLQLLDIRKGGGGLAADLLPGDPCTEGAPGEAAVLRVGPEDTLRLPVDLARLSGDWLERGSLWLQAAFRPEGEGPDLSSNMPTLRVERPPDAGPRGLRLLASLQAGPGLAVTLRNEGEKPLRVPRDFAWPSRLHVSVSRPAGTEGEGWITVDGADGKSLFTSKVVGWDVAGPRRALAAGDFVDLAPGESMAVTVPLVADHLPRFPAGEYEARVSWRNVESGVRAGLEPGSVLVGTVSSAPVRVEMPQR